MDLFTTIAADFEISPTLTEDVFEICRFVKEVTPSQLETIRVVQEAREFELWEKSARSMQAFAYTHNLKDEWWNIVDLIKAERIGTFWHSGWDAAFDHSLATMLKPWSGTVWPKPDYELLTEPLHRAGLTV